MSQSVQTYSDINTLEQLYELIKTLHNPALVKNDESPGANTIYHIYNDGEITYQKGGWAYQQRSEFTSKYGLYKKIDPNQMPIKTKSVGFSREIHGYAIVSEHDANIIRNLIDKLV